MSIFTFIFYFSISSMAASSKWIYLKREEERILNRWYIQTGQGDSLFSFLKEINRAQYRGVEGGKEGSRIYSFYP